MRHQRRDAARLGRATWCNDVVETTGVRVGIHCHNDTGCAVANTLAAVDAGATHVQGTHQRVRRAHRQRRPGLGRRQPRAQARTGRCCPPGLLRDATRIAHAVAEVTNFPPASRQPYVGTSAFTHKAGLHASAIKVDPNLYQHLDPVHVGNDMRLLVSDMAGRASIELKGRELGFDLSGDKELVTPGHRAGQGAGVARLHVRGRRRLLRAAAASRRSRARGRRTSTSSRGGSSPRPGPATRRSPRPP